MHEFSYLLGARPSFVEGVSQILDFGGTMNEYNQSMTPEQADYFALLADWRLIGVDIQGALLHYADRSSNRGMHVR